MKTVAADGNCMFASVALAAGYPVKKGYSVMDMLRGACIAIARFNGDTTFGLSDTSLKMQSLFPDDWELYMWLMLQNTEPGAEMIALLSIVCGSPIRVIESRPDGDTRSYDPILLDAVATSTPDVVLHLVERHYDAFVPKKLELRPQEPVPLTISGILNHPLLEKMETLPPDFCVGYFGGTDATWKDTALLVRATCMNLVALSQWHSDHHLQMRDWKSIYTVGATPTAAAVRCYTNILRFLTPRGYNASNPVA